LPSESDFMRQFEVGRNTVRSALAHLRSRGIVETIDKRGSFPMKELPPPAP
jgi:DNA-binding GntR family transcriptional regulator